MNKNENALISTAVLTAIWDSTHKDNIGLIIPFVIDIIYNKFEINEAIDEEYIIRQLKEQFCFNKFPHAVLKIVLIRMKKMKILISKDKKFILAKDLKDESKEFRDKLNVAKLDTSRVINDIIQYLKENLEENVSQHDAEAYFSNFISSYGYNAYENINSVRTIERKKDVYNYMIGEFIYKEYNKNSETFKLILKIIEGYMIANAIYLQIENNNKASLKKLNCYLDTPFLLKVLGYKSDEENASAKELYDLLVKYKANLKCFEHNFIEIEKILEFYKNNISNNREITLEYFDKEKYSEGQVEMAISSLPEKLEELHIKRVDTPEYTVDNYKQVINVEKLTNMLKQHKDKMRYYYNQNAIENDVKSVCAINMLRKGKRTSKIEECTDIFVTPYYFLKKATDEIMDELSETDIGLVIDDLDLTTILWFKDFEKNSELPKMRLVENALAATNASDEIMEKTTKIYESIKRDGLVKNIDNVSDIITKTYLKATGYVDVVKNDADLVTKESIIEFLSRKDVKIEEQNRAIESRDIEIENKKKQLDAMKKELENERKKSAEKEQNTQKKLMDASEKKINAKYDKEKSILHKIYYIILSLFTITALGGITHSIIHSNGFIVSGILLVTNIISLVDTFYPKARKGLNMIDRYIDNKRKDDIAIENKRIIEDYTS